jgi:5'-3' exonuclease
VVRVHLIDGTYELFRTWFGAPPAQVAGREVGASRAFLRSTASLLRTGEVTHIACAFDHVIESFRNDLFAGYKTGAGLEEDLVAQFPLVEQVSAALGIATWPMVEFECDDGLATAAHAFADHPEVEQVIIASPDKDLCQCVRGDKVITWDRLRGTRLDEDGVIAKFGIGPASIPDYLALVGDDADGVPGLPRWGARSAAAVLSRWRHLEAIPDDDTMWEVPVRGRAVLAQILREHRTEVMLYRTLTTLRTDAQRETGPLTLAAVAWEGVDAAALAALAPVLDVDPASLDLPIRSRTTASR